MSIGRNDRGIPDDLLLVFRVASIVAVIAVTFLLGVSVAFEKHSFSQGASEKAHQSIKTAGELSKAPEGALDEIFECIGKQAKDSDEVPFFKKTETLLGGLDSEAAERAISGLFVERCLERYRLSAVNASQGRERLSVVSDLMEGYYEVHGVNLEVIGPPAHMTSQ